MSAAVPAYTLIGKKKLGMWLFIAADSLTFAALLVSYTYLRLANSNWPLPFHLIPSLALATLMTLILLTSSLTMVKAVDASRRGGRPRGYLLATMGGGLAFIFLHAREWQTLVRAGVTPFDNPWGVPLFGATFYALTGLHMLHVAGGVVYLAALWLRLSRVSAEDVETAGLYWHFVDLVWMFIYPLVYLMSANI